MVSLNWGRNMKGEAFVFFSIIIIVKKIRDPKHGKQRHVAQVLSKITSRTICMGHIQVTENHGAITLLFQGCALGHSITGASALVVAAVTCSL